MVTSGDKQAGSDGLPGRRRLGVAAGLVLAFFAVVFLLDRPVTEAVARWPAVEHQFFEWLTEFGEGAVVLVPALVLWLATLIAWRLTRPFWMRWSLRALSAMSGFTFAAVGLPGLTTAILKRLFGRARPVWLDEEGVFAFSFLQPVRWDFQSFPSGHATTSLAFALAMTLLFGRAGAWVFVPAVLIAFSRVVVGMHFVSDVLFGAGLGVFGAWAVARYWRHKGMVFGAGPGWRNRMAPVLVRQWRRLSRRRRGSA